ncbi:hypothetical protein SAMN05444483_102378 [Salegentibacter echinorum]|uniref:Uncharacterized protein n=1 Tax=Salegentibacter echinorum TaxID=1073325 RepID=A0A1M5EHM2_SALEC|nr:hypothetical protein SAMN05444483_102378 [Salegentibacter echinorum]
MIYISLGQNSDVLVGVRYFFSFRYYLSFPSFNFGSEEMNSFKLSPLAEKFPFFAHFLSFYSFHSPEVSGLCKSKKNPSNEQKMAEFCFKVNSLNEFYRIL